MQGTVTQDARWAARQFAEHATVVNQDEQIVIVDLDLLPPGGERVAPIMLASGTSTKVKPGSLLPKRQRYVEVLRQHHSVD